MDDNFDVNDIRSLDKAQKYLEDYTTEIRENFKKDSSINMLELANTVATRLEPYKILYNNESEDKLRDDLTSIFKDKEPKLISRIFYSRAFILMTIKIISLNANIKKYEILLNKQNTPQKVTYYEEMLSHYKQWQTKSKKEHENMKTSIEKDYNEKLPEFRLFSKEEEEKEKQRQDNQPQEVNQQQQAKKPSYMSSLFQNPFGSLFKSTTGGMATRKKKYRRRYKKQIKRRTKKTRSRH